MMSGPLLTDVAARRRLLQFRVGMRSVFGVGSSGSMHQIAREDGRRLVDDARPLISTVAVIGGDMSHPLRVYRRCYTIPARGITQTGDTPSKSRHGEILWRPE